MAICEVEGCNTKACYNYEGEKKGARCKTDILPGMIDVVHPRCGIDGCKTRPYYNLPGETRGIRCSTHKPDGYVDVINRQCREEGCTKQPSQNLPGVKPGITCSEHGKKYGFQDVVNKRCGVNGCQTMPSFNFEGKKTAIRCSEHADPLMIDIKSKQCQEPGCYKNPIFNFPEETTPIYCDSHKHSGMTDVKNKKCSEEGCEKQPRFNYKGETVGVFCSTHADKKLMWDVLCIRCKSCGLFAVEKKHNYLCSYCDVNRSKVRAKKENEVKLLLEKMKIKFIHDKQISNDCCLKYRPDFLIDCGTYFLIVECDEFAHADYEKECEITRMQNISFGLGLPTRFIRYNPDKKGIKKKDKEFQLAKCIKEQMSQEYLEDTEAIYLFY